MLEGLNQVTATQKNELGLDSIQHVAKHVYHNLFFCLNLLFLAHTVFGSDTWSFCLHSPSMIIAGMSKSLRLLDLPLI